MGHNDPIRVYRGRGYRAIYWHGLFPATPCVDSVYLGLNRGYSHKLLMLELRLVLVVKQSSQYIVYGCLDSDGVVASTVILSAVGTDSTLRSTSLTYFRGALL